MGEAKRKREMGGDRPPQPPVDWFRVEFIDSGREPQVAPDPDYPEGIDLDVTGDALVQSCKLALPYPAPRCGVMTFACRRCGFSAGATVAGRPDDPRTVRVPCKAQAGATGRFPEGISERPGDQGEIAIAVSKPDAGGNVYIDFGKEVSWISLKKEQVLQTCLMMLSRIGVEIRMEPPPKE